MNCVPAPEAPEVDEPVLPEDGAVVAACAAGAAVAAAPAGVNVPWPRALAAFALGEESPCPQPPSRVF